MDESLTPKIIRIATRKSPLALWQAQMVGQQLKKIDEIADKEKFSKNCGKRRKYAGIKLIKIMKREAGNNRLALLSKK